MHRAQVRVGVEGLARGQHRRRVRSRRARRGPRPQRRGPRRPGLHQPQGGGVQPTHAQGVRGLRGRQHRHRHDARVRVRALAGPRCRTPCHLDASARGQRHGHHQRTLRAQMATSLCPDAHHP